MLKFENNTLDSSKLNDFQKCPRYFFYRHVLGWETEGLNNHLVFGTSWHLAMEQLLLGGYGKNNIIKAFEIFYKDYRKSFNPDTDGIFEPKTPDNAFLVLAKYAEKYQGELENLEVLHTEIAGKIAINDGQNISFRMDSILRDKKTGKVFSREHKTGSRTWQWDEQWILAMQPGTYSHVLYCLFPQNQVDGIEMNGCFFIKRKNDPFDFRRFHVKKTPAQMQVWLDNVRFYWGEVLREYELLEQETQTLTQTMQAFPLRTISCLSYGRVCEYQDFCLAWPNPLLRSDEPPIGFKERFWNPLEEQAKTKFNLDVLEYKEPK